MKLPESPPHSTHAEQATLGAMLADAEQVVDLIAKLRPDNFHDPVHRAVFEAITRMSEDRKSIDLVTVAERLKGSHPCQAAGGSAYLAELCTQYVSISHAQEYARIVRDKAVHRSVASAGTAISKLARNEELSATEVLERAEQEILAVSREAGESDPQHISDVASEAYEDYVRLHEASDREESAAPRTGFQDLDALVGELEPGALVVIAARPSMGKTAMALGIGRNIAEKQGKTMAIFSLEMTKRQLHDRIVAGVLGKDIWKAPPRRLWPSSGPPVGDCLRAIGSLDGVPKVLPAASSAFSTTPTDPPLDFSKEPPGNTGFDAGRRVERDRDTMGNRLLVACQIGDQCVKGVFAKVLAELGEIASLIEPGFLVSRNQVP